MGIIENTPMGGMRPYEINDSVMVPLPISQRLSQGGKIQNIIGRIRAGREPCRCDDGGEKLF